MALADAKKQRIRRFLQLRAVDLSCPGCDVPLAIARAAKTITLSDDFRESKTVIGYVQVSCPRCPHYDVVDVSSLKLPAE
jgi:hypothetical protein